MCHLDDTPSILDHLDLSDIVCPRRILEQRGDFVTQIDQFAEDGRVDGESGVVGPRGSFTCQWILGEFELQG